MRSLPLVAGARSDPRRDRITETTVPRLGSRNTPRPVRRAGANTYTFLFTSTNIPVRRSVCEGQSA